MVAVKKSQAQNFFRGFSLSLQAAQKIFLPRVGRLKVLALRLNKNLELLKIVGGALLQKKHKVRLEACAVVEGVNGKSAFIADEIDLAENFFQFVDVLTEICDESFFLARAEVVVVSKPIFRAQVKPKIRGDARIILRRADTAPLDLGKIYNFVAENVPNVPY